MKQVRLSILCAVLGAALVAGGFVCAAQDDSQGKKNASSNHARKLTTTRNDKADDQGERVFAANCSRCHNAPEGFSPRIGGTIIRHMRVRANLSQDDERALLKFLNP